MSLGNKERMIAELQMLTGIVTNDLDYLIYKLLKDGTYFSEDIKDINVMNEGSLGPEIAVMNFEDWFTSLEEVGYE